MAALGLHRNAMLHRDDTILWLPLSAFWIIWAELKKTLTSWVDVAVLPIDFNHEITWTEHLFVNYILSIIFSQLYSANYIHPIIFSQCTWQWYWVGGNYFTSGCRLSVGWPFASSSVLKVRRTAKCFRWSPTWATSAVWQLIDNWYMWRKIVCLYRPAWPGWQLHPALPWCPPQWELEPHSLHHLWKYTHEVS